MMADSEEHSEPHDVQRPWDIVRQALAAEDAENIQSFLTGLSLSEALRAILHLDEEERARVMTLIDADVAADIIEEAPSEQAAEIVEDLETETAAEILEELESDVQTDVITELDEEDAEEILAQMDPEAAEDIRRLAEYDPETAGGLMMAEAFSFAADETVGTALRRITEGDEDFERYRGQHPYVLDERGALLGVVSLRNLLTAPRHTHLGEIIAPAISVSPETNLSDLEDLMDKHPFLGLPVIDEAGKLIGSLARSAVADAALERSESDSLKQQGVIGDELRSLPLLLRARRRLSWLSANIVLNVIAASVIAAYTDTLAVVIAIAVFLPMVSDMSGCSGNQAVAVSLRELALGLAKPVDIASVWLKEISIGVINGLALGVLIALVAWLWMGSAYLGLVIGLALALNTMISVSIGGIVPLVLKRFEIDPAVASGPLLTTATDMAGFFLVLSLATLFMPLLTA